MINRVGVVGLGDMGSGIARNLIAGGFTVTGFDLSPDRMKAFREMGGAEAESAAAVGAASEAVFVMVMTGAQARSVILGEGLCATMRPGGVILMTATIQPSEVRAIAAELADSGLDLVDTPVSGGFPGAQSGALTLMAAGSEQAIARAQPAMAAISKVIHRVGDEPGMGQTVKACLQSLIGSIFAATFEAAALAAKAGVSGQALHDVVSSSSAGCGAANTALGNIIDRQFTGTGSHIATMHKDLTIALDMARELGVPLFSAATAMQLFHAGKTRHPEGDNWIVTRVIEEIVGAELHR